MHRGRQTSAQAGIGPFPLRRRAGGYLCHTAELPGGLLTRRNKLCVNAFNALRAKPLCIRSPGGRATNSLFGAVHLPSDGGYATIPRRRTKRREESYTKLLLS